MLNWINYALVYAGIAVMVYNVYGFVRYARYVQGQQSWKERSTILYIPIVLVVLFLLGYIAVALFGEPDLIIGGILFGGSLFVLFMHWYLNSITHRVVESERLNSELLAAEKSSEARKQFLASMSHEMHTPLNVILGMDALALKNPGVPPEAREQLQKIQLSANHLLGLIDNALDLNRLETGMLEIKNEEFSLSEALEQINAIAQSNCEDKGLTYKFEGPQQQTGCRFVGDETNLKRVLLSILDNAVKYTDAPGTVTFGVQRDEAGDDKQALRFTISDTGVGMDSDFLPNIFTAFTQEDASSTNRYGGSGMSLAVAKNLIELMGGTIEVESQKNVGTTFIVSVALPCTKEQGPVEEEPEAKPAEALNGARILIVEDIEENAEIVADLLELEGAETERAENGQVALDMIGESEESYYDAILMDLRMPVMDGLEATRRIRAMDRTDTKTVPIIALTANAFEEDKRRSFEVGMNAHLAKPTDSNLLCDTLGRFILAASEQEGAKQEATERADAVQQASEQEGGESA